MDKLKQNLKIGDEVECSSCRGRGWYSVGHDDAYERGEHSSEHNCHNCRTSGYLEVVGFNKHGAILRPVDNDWVWGEDGDFS
tara:strand:- start:114 stop:359 length:246 start_codon:yes stop_codon:yes gene_type:complete